MRGAATPQQTANAFAASGAYSMTVNVPSGTTPTYSVRPILYTDQWYDYLQAPVSTVQVAANATATLDFNLTPAYIEGHIALPSGASATIGAHSSDGAWYASTSTNNSRGGDFHFPVLPGSSVRVWATFYPSTGGSLNFEVTTFASVLAGETKVIEVTPPAASGSVSGVLTVNGPRTPNIAYMSTSGPQYKSVQVGAGGAYAIDDLVNGRYWMYSTMYFDNWQTYLQAPYGTEATGFPQVDIAGTAVSFSPTVNLGLISGTVALIGTKTLAAVNYAQINATGEYGSPSQGARRTVAPGRRVRVDRDARQLAPEHVQLLQLLRQQRHRVHQQPAEYL